MLFLVVVLVLCIIAAWSTKRFERRKMIENFSSDPFVSLFASSVNLATFPIQSTLSKHPNVKFKRCDQPVTKIEKNILDKFNQVDNEAWDVYVPCGYTFVEKELENNDHFVNRKTKGWVLGIQGADNFAAKDRAWNMLLKRYGRLRATIFMPESWVTYEPLQMTAFHDHVRKHPSDTYIMKKNIQQQKGLKIIRRASEVDGAFGDGFVVVQRILKDPFLVNGRKINIRVYILVVCVNGKKNALRL